VVIYALSSYIAISEFTFNVKECEFKLKCVIIFSLQEYYVYICPRIQLVTVSIYIINDKLNFWLMVNLNLSYADYSVLLQSLLSRMDDLTSKIQFYTDNNNSEMVSVLKDDFSDVYVLYIKLKNT
jgi:predicted amino acid-binding ACT domain protein